MGNPGVVEYDHPSMGRTKTIGFLMKFFRTPAAIQSPPPEFRCAPRRQKEEKMKKLAVSGSWLLLVFILVASACAPAAAPAPSPAPAPQAAPAAPALSPEEAAWAKVVEAARKEGRVTFYSQAFVGEAATHFTKAFVERTGIGLDIITSPASSPLIERIKAEVRTGTRIASVLNGAGTMMRLVQQDGLVDNIGYLPELRDESIWTVDPRLDKDYILSMYLVDAGPWVHTSLVPPGKEPKSWRDLLKPEWKGKMGLADPTIIPTPNQIYHALTSRGRLDDAYFRALGQQDLQYAPNSHIEAERLAKREVSLSLSMSVSSIKRYLDEGLPLRPLDMQEGHTLLRSGGVVLLKGAPSPNAARVLINFLLSPEGQTPLLKYTGRAGYRKDVPSGVPQVAQISWSHPIVLTLEDEVAIPQLIKDRVLAKLLGR